MVKDKICSICEISIDENYCSRCGQKVTGKSTSTISLVNDFFSSFLSMEKSGFATILKILSDPKPIVNNYFYGYKNYYASPGKILLYGIAFVALHIYFVDNKVMELSLEDKNINAQYLFWLILFPVLLSISYVAFVRKEKNFSKHIISITYIASSLFVALTFLNDIVILIWEDKLGIWAFVIFISCVFFWNSRVFSSKQTYLQVMLNTAIQLIIFIGLICLLVLKTNQMNG